jgi:HD-like signal output (HDOD) protein
MKITCVHCAKAYDIPDKRLPFGQEISFPCQACKAIIKVDLRVQKSTDPVQPTQANIPETKDQINPLQTPPSSAKDQTLPEGDALRAKIMRLIEDLPSMPQTIIKARQVMADPGSGLRDIAEILETDQGISIQVLRLANSSYYGWSGKVSSLEQAAVLLGHKTLAEIISIAATCKLLGGVLPGYGMESGALWRHSLAVAIGSQIIAQKRQPQLTNDAFICGLIHDAGKLILDKYISERKEAFNAFIGNGRESYRKAEKHLLGFDHSEIAADVCRRWMIPNLITIGVRYHHYPSRAQGNLLAYIVHLADAMAIVSGIGISIAELDMIDDKAMAVVGLQAEELEHIKLNMLATVEKITSRIEEVSLEV